MRLFIIYGCANANNSHLKLKDIENELNIECAEKEKWIQKISFEEQVELKGIVKPGAN